MRSFVVVGLLCCGCGSNGGSSGADGAQQGDFDRSQANSERPPNQGRKTAELYGKVILPEGAEGRVQLDIKMTIEGEEVLTTEPVDGDGDFRVIVQADVNEVSLEGWVIAGQDPSAGDFHVVYPNNPIVIEKTEGEEFAVVKDIVFNFPEAAEKAAQEKAVAPPGEGTEKGPEGPALDQ